jgi:hypothetical protein
MQASSAFELGATTPEAHRYRGADERQGHAEVQMPSREILTMERVPEEAERVTVVVCTPMAPFVRQTLGNTAMKRPALPVNQALAQCLHDFRLGDACLLAQLTQRSVGRRLPRFHRSFAQLISSQRVLKGKDLNRLALTKNDRACFHG